MSYDGALGHSLLVLEELETKGISLISGRDWGLKVYDQGLVNILDIQGLVTFPSRQYSLCVLFYPVAKKSTALQDPVRRGQMEALHLNPSQTLLYEHLPLTDFNL